LADVREASAQAVEAEFWWHFPEVVPLEMSRILPL
jgi:hypothetical protein